MRGGTADGSVLGLGGGPISRPPIPGSGSAWEGSEVEPNADSQRLKRFSTRSWLGGWAGPLLRQHPGSFATNAFFTRVLPPRTLRRLQRSRERGSCTAPQAPAAPGPVHSLPSDPSTSTAHLRPRLLGLGAPAPEGGPACSYLDEPQLRALSHSRARSVTVLGVWVPRTS